MKKRLLSAILVIAMAGVMLAGCGSKESSSEDTAAESTEKKEVVKIGIRADMVNQLEAVRDEIEALGYTVEESVFDDSIQPDVALAEAAVGAILTPVIFIITLNKVKTKEGEKCKKE